MLTSSYSIFHGAPGLRPIARGRRFVISEWERGVLFRHGRHQADLDPGAHRLWANGLSMARVDLRPWVLTMPLQEVPTADGVTVRISLALRVKVADALAFVTASQSPIEQVYLAAQVGLRELAATSTVDALVAGRSELGRGVLARASEGGVEVGIEIGQVELKDIVLPVDLRRAQAQVLLARAEGAAALERARGETAALRSLANAARLAADQPALLQLRLLQQLAASPGHTVVIGGQATVTPAG